MKRKKLLRHLEANGCAFVREGGDHTIYRRTGTNRQSSIPRHSEIDPFLVRKICKDLDVPRPNEK